MGDGGHPMIEGEIVCRRSDAFGEIIVADCAGKRFLYFDNDTRQSCMDIDRPVALEMEYTKAMMCALILHRRVYWLWARTRYLRGQTRGRFQHLAQSAWNTIAKALADETSFAAESLQPWGRIA